MGAHHREGLRYQEALSLADYTHSWLGENTLPHRYLSLAVALLVGAKILSG